MNEQDFSFYSELLGNILLIFRWLSLVPGIFIFTDIKKAMHDIKKWILTALMGTLLSYGCFHEAFLAVTEIYQTLINKISESLDYSNEQAIQDLYLYLMISWGITCLVYVILTVIMLLIIKKIVRIRYPMTLFEAAHLSIMNIIAFIMTWFFTKIALVPLDGSVFVLHDEVKASPLVFASVAVLLFAGEAFLIAAWQKNKTLMEKEELLIAERLQADSLKRRLAETELEHKRLKDFRHDLRNHVSTLHGLLSTGASREAGIYLENMEESIRLTEQRYSTGFAVLDVILNDKAAEADRQGAAFSASVTVQELPDAMHYDVAILITNLLDNAIKATVDSKNDNPYVFISIIQKNRFLLITIKNSYSGTLKLDPVSHLPIKDNKDSDGHGLGIPNALSICDRYLGTLEYAQDGDNISAIAMMQYLK